MLGKKVESVTIKQVIVSEAVDHKEEYYASAQSTRDGVEILATTYGGVEVEANWEKVKRILVDIGETPIRCCSFQDWPKMQVFWETPPPRWPNF